MSKVKGRVYEKELEAHLQSMGLPAWRVPLSGALGGRFGSDIRISLPDGELTFEVKMRSNPSKGVATLIKRLPAFFVLDGATYHVLRLEDLPLDTHGNIEVRPTKAVLKWLGQNSALAIRLPKRILGGSGWVIVIRDSSLVRLRSVILKSSSHP
jgi:hypothetical protein